MALVILKGQDQAAAMFSGNSLPRLTEDRSFQGPKQIESDAWVSLPGQTEDSHRPQAPELFQLRHADPCQGRG
jgi:hypothetical protein